MTEGDNVITLTRTKHDLPEEWTDSQVAEWMEVVGTDVETVRNATGVLYYDPTRVESEVRQWSDLEIVAYLKGELLKMEQSHVDDAIAECRQRTTEIPMAWTNQETLDFITQNIVPARTESGVWVNDQTRNTRSSNDWTDEELVAWSRGDIESGNTTDNNDRVLAMEFKDRFNLESINLDDMIKEYRGDVDTQVDEPVVQVEKPKPSGALTKMNESYIEETLNRYVEAVKPGTPISDETGGAAQRQLDQLFRYTFKLEGKAFVEGLDRIKYVVGLNLKGVFSPDNAYRFVHMLRGDTSNQRNHVNMIELFITAAGPNKARLRQMDIRQLVKGAPVDKREMLVEYFTTR